MIGIDTIYVILFFAAAGICLIFAAAWIANSESKRHILKNEIGRIKAQLEERERDKYLLQEKVEDLMEGGAGASPAENKSVLERENARLKKELAEARSSLEDVYKALA